MSDAPAKTRAGLKPALIMLGAIFVADQLTKLWILHRVDFSAGPIEALPFLNFTLVWNRGISYGLFQTEGMGRWVLVGLTVAGTVALSVWLARARHRLVRFSLAAIVGGALGNLVDRVAYGAVVDFVHLHAAGYSWYVFNIADAAIVIGVLGLLWDSFFGAKHERLTARP
ncbi:MAG: signal peptidase II [Pseudomonadota bacterium]